MLQGLGPSEGYDAANGAHQTFTLMDDAASNK